MNEWTLTTTEQLMVDGGLRTLLQATRMFL